MSFGHCLQMRPKLARFRTQRCLSLVTMFLVAVSSYLFMQESAKADVVRIASINQSEFNPLHDGTVSVKPGDMVSLVADVFSEEETDSDELYDSQNRSQEEFIWSSDFNPGAECVVARPEECERETEFEVTDFGVNFYVPYNMGEKIYLTLRHRSLGDRDQIVLVNSLSRLPAPTAVITQPEDYSYDEFSSVHALAGQGRYVTIFGERYWVPDSYKDDWTPYQNGYWTWNSGHGWTWVSHDPWGWYTDHYGYWRHHKNFGWVWKHFSDRRFRPHSVTFYYGDGFVGWSPFYSGTTAQNLYRLGYEAGFDDGFWMGANVGNEFIQYPTRYRLGLTFVNHQHFYSPNIFSVRVSFEVGLPWFTFAHRSRAFGIYFGGRDLAYSRSWIESRCFGGFPTTEIEFRVIGRYHLYYPRRIHSIPDFYRPFHHRRPIPLVERGSIRRVGSPVFSATVPSVGSGRPATFPRRGLAVPVTRTRQRFTVPRGGVGSSPSTTIGQPRFPRQPSQPNQPHQPNQPRQPRQPSTPQTPSLPGSGRSQHGNGGSNTTHQPRVPQSGGWQGGSQGGSRGGSQPGSSRQNPSHPSGGTNSGSVGSRPVSPEVPRRTESPRPTPGAGRTFTPVRTTPSTPSTPSVPRAGNNSGGVRTPRNTGGSESRSGTIRQPASSVGAPSVQRSPAPSAPRTSSGATRTERSSTGASRRH